MASGLMEAEVCPYEEHVLSDFRLEWRPITQQHGYNYKIFNRIQRLLSNVH